MKLLALLLRGKLRINNYDLQGNSVEAILLKLQKIQFRGKRHKQGY